MLNKDTNKPFTELSSIPTKTSSVLTSLSINSRLYLGTDKETVGCYVYIKTL